MVIVFGSFFTSGENRTMKALALNNETMTSREILDILNKDKKDDEPKMELKELHREIKQMFPSEIDGGKIPPSLDSRGYVEFYLLPEVESKMLVAKKDVNYLRQITEYWVNKGATKPSVPTDFATALQLAADQQKLIQQQTEQLAIAAPKVELLGLIQTETPKMSVSNWAKSLSNDVVKIKPNLLMAFLRDTSILLVGRDKHEKNKPRQNYIASGWFEFEPTQNTHTGKYYYQALVTALGQEKLSKWVVEHYPAWVKNRKR